MNDELYILEVPFMNKNRKIKKIVKDEEEISVKKIMVTVLITKLANITLDALAAGLKKGLVYLQQVLFTYLGTISPCAYITPPDTASMLNPQHQEVQMLVIEDPYYTAVGSDTGNIVYFPYPLHQN